MINCEYVSKGDTGFYRITGPGIFFTCDANELNDTLAEAKELLDENNN